MNILIITPRIPYPPFRGDKLKIFNIAKILSKNNSVTIFTFLRSKKYLKDLEKLEKHGIKVEVVKLSIIPSLIKIFFAVFTSTPFQVAWFQSSKMKKKITASLKEGKFDVVYYHLIRSAQYLDADSSSTKILNVIDFTDAVSLYLKRFAEIEKNPIKKLFIKIEQKRIENYEKIAEKFHTLFICSPIDQDFLKKRGINANVKILKNGLDVSYFKPSDIEFDSKRIIFTGNMPYYANYDAAIFFANEIFPIILQKIPDAEFYIVGQKPPKRIINLASENIIVTGFVQDIKAEYQKSAVNVAPMRFGAGTLNKVIESIALGVPVVATSIATAGLPEELIKFIFVADSKEKFADYVINVLQNENIRKSYVSDGKSLITSTLSWDKIVGEFEEYLVKEVSQNKN